MADYKNQHFVPRAHFKPFSVDGEGHAINLYLIEHDRPVMQAPIKGQCARDYLYGKDGRLEKLLGRLEGRYGEVVQRLEVHRHCLDDAEQSVLRYFILLQSLRTAEQIERGFAQMSQWADFMRAAEQAHGNKWDERENPTRQLVMINLMSAFYEQMQLGVLDDMKVAIVRNRTGHDFVTSDDPAVTTNRWLLQRKKISTFGSNAAGLVMLMPLSPRQLALVYDAAVYSPPSEASGKINAVKEADVLALNAHQYMRAVSSIYIRKPADADRVAAEFRATRSSRPDTWDRFTVAKRESETEAHVSFTVGAPNEIAKEDSILFHFAREWPTPPSWPSLLRVRGTAHGYSKGRRIIRQARIEDMDALSAHLFRRVT